jgi:glycosyltransferase involved in cell wall biosynthesis
MALSFIIPAHNEAEYVARTIAAAQRAARDLTLPYEVIVVDDSSSDDTAAIAARHEARVVPVAYRQIAAARNAGARVATGDLFVFVDADTEINVQVLRAVVDAVGTGAVGGGSHFRFDGRVPVYGQCMQVFADIVYPLARLASGCFLFCTRQAFEAVGGFDETRYAAEEAIMSRALRRHGRFVVVRPAVTTSGRKLRAYRGREMLAMAARLVRARNMGQHREGLDVWYGERRPDPEPPQRID